MLFYDPISAHFHNSICAAFNFNETVDCCIENITEFVNVIKKFRDAKNCPLSAFQVNPFLRGLQNYLDNERKSSPLLRKYYFQLCGAYLTGFRGCVFIARKKYLLIILRKEGEDKNRN